MRNDLEHPEITAALRFGRPAPIHDDTILCTECERIIDEQAYDYDGDLLCDECFKDRIMEDMDADDLALKLGFIVKSVFELMQEQEEM